MRCSKSCHLYDLELVNLFDNGVLEQVYSRNARNDRAKKLSQRFAQAV